MIAYLPQSRLDTLESERDMTTTYRMGEQNVENTILGRSRDATPDRSVSILNYSGIGM